jgi:hypothetical protein
MRATVSNFLVISRGAKTHSFNDNPVARNHTACELHTFPCAAISVEMFLIDS